MLKTNNGFNNFGNTGTIRESNTNLFGQFNTNGDQNNNKGTTTIDVGIECKKDLIEKVPKLEKKL